ncbi:GNAT family N-acetyltransferase [Kutzneria sp. 744]|uniref:GNAT family N-acetyltransferase n=1 Tax=Kutzneria sp. (strain 744) TaxID=345341 RepID=UPI0003EEB936|nr:GNAT family N-acetyltransferase [Kutzneria sp. 744]EWM17440.1 toxin-antitoxin system, toxin component [Kutzneria sp. 744]
MIRAAEPADLPALYDVCVRTADAGGDARHLYPDQDLMPTIFLAPYVALDPSLAFVVDDGSRAVGYVVGTASTEELVRRWRSEWLPAVIDRYPAPTSSETPTDQMLGLLHQPERMIVPELAEYPAHLHIDLLPEYQGKGLGRQLISRFLGALAARDVPAVHLGMVTANVGARKFYDRLGFHVIDVPDAGVLTYLGRATS